MAYTSGFFDAVDQGGGDYDREYSAATFAHYFSLLVQNGVFPDPSTGMQVKASTSPDMHVSVQPGNGWVNGYYITVKADAPEQLTVPTANPSLSRIDSVIMGLNYVDREVQLYIKSGAVSASPSAVSLQRDNDLYELELAQITVSAGMASITQASITDMRSNTSRCGIVKGMIDQIDTTDLFAQYDTAFHNWFDELQNQLSGDVAVSLQNQVNQLKSTKADAINLKQMAFNESLEAAVDFAKDSYGSSLTGNERNSGYLLGSTLTGYTGNARPIGETLTLVQNPITCEFSQVQTPNVWYEQKNKYNGSTYAYSVLGVGFKVSPGMTVTLSKVKVSWQGANTESGKPQEYPGAGYSGYVFNEFDIGILRLDPKTFAVTQVLKTHSFGHVRDVIGYLGPIQTEGTWLTLPEPFTYTTTKADKYLAVVLYNCADMYNSSSNPVYPLAIKSAAPIGIFDRCAYSFRDSSETITLQQAVTSKKIPSLGINEAQYSAAKTFPCWDLTITGGLTTGSVSASFTGRQDNCNYASFIVEADTECNFSVTKGNTVLEGTSFVEVGKSANGSTSKRNIFQVQSPIQKTDKLTVSLSDISTPVTVYDICYNAR